MDTLCLKTGIHGIAPSISVTGSLEVRSNASQVSALARDKSATVAAAPPQKASSMFSFRDPLQSLWPGGGQSNRYKGMAVDDAVLVDHGEGRSGTGEDSGNRIMGTSEGQNENWVMKILHVRSLWKEEEMKSSSGEGSIEEGDVAALNDALNKEEECDICRVEDDEDKEIEFDKDSFSRLLRKVSFAEAKLYLQMSYLGSLAYSIPKIKAGNLLKYRGLHFVTSSIEKRELAMKAEKVQVSDEGQEVEEGLLEKEAEEGLLEKEAEGTGQKNNGHPISASTAYQIAASAASYLHSHTKSIRLFKSLKGKTGKNFPEGDSGGNKNLKMLNSEVASLMATTDSVTAVVAAKEEVKQAVADDLSSTRSSPCEWFICDNDQDTRFFVIQGSESLESWKANLLFEPVQFEVRAKLLSGGGVDTGQYSQNCTHVIVDKILFDDPLCVAARNDGKTLVTGLWVDHSYDIGMAVDATSIMYRPLRDLNGIEGAERLIVCLTGYQRQDRDDIMTMVGLMGAQFSKPLVANKVTHLICYKFEGEKYELAKKLKKIKLVNHRWLEDCLRDWELLPEDNYSKSGYELEAMEAEAKDSEEEAEGPTVKQSSHEMANRSPHLRMGTPKSCQMPTLTGELPKMACNLSEPEGMPSVGNGKDMLVTPSRKNRSASGFISNFVSEASPCPVSDASNDAPSVGLHNPQEKTPNSTKGGSDLETISGSAERPYSDAKFSARSYTRKNPRTSPISTFSGKLGNTRGSPKVQLGESIDKSSAKFESAKDLTGSGHVEVLPRTSELFHEEASSSKKQKMDVSCFNPKSHDMGHEPPRSVTGSPSVSCNQGLEQPHLVDGLSKINNQHPDVTGSPLVSLDAAAQKSHSDVSIGKASKFKTKQLMQDLLPLEDAASEDERKKDADENMPQTSLKALKKSSLASKPEVGDFGVKKSEDLVADAEVPCHQQQDRQVPSPFNRNLEGEKSQTIANLEGLEEGNGNLMTKRLRTKMIAKKTLGSRPKLKSTANLKGSIYLNKVAAQSDPAVGLPREIAGHENFSSFNELEISPATVDAIAVKEVETKIDPKSGDNTENATTVMDDETEPPEDKDTHEGVHDEEKDGVVDLSSKADDNTKVKPDVPQHSTNNTAADMDDGAKEDKIAVQSQQKDKTTCKANGMKGKVRQGKKQPSGKSKTKTVLTLSGHAKSKQASDGEKTCNGEDIVEKVMGEEKGKPCSAGQTKSRTISKRKSENSMEVDKENKQIVDGDQNISQFQGHVRKTALKSDVSMKANQKSRKRDPKCVLVREVSKQLETEPIWFILSGHKLQRKEFQQVIRRLKGKVCRDSHQWSYQATHFIAPDPIRRTEKFFAAAASGRWILKTDYLAACSQAGRFLGEEPYEWHKHGLSEDGAINLEAPRKWRLLREKTGHGAFYGMRVIIYGDCIAPSLDTLKRVVKAGDGTILATSPPYTRFLSSGVDYAIVSPGMPRVDLWVQEFMRHEIPCIVADYLVEYVCKPGYSLERHVLYNTQAWAERSFANLLSKAEDIVEGLTPSDDCSNDDTTCEVCGSHDRGEVMLICGDESGSVGCGIGMHIDCCDPPLENIPDEDWFCPNCSNSNSSPKRRKGA